MTRIIEHGHCSTLGEYVTTKRAVLYSTANPSKFSPSEIDMSIPASFPSSSNFVSFSAFIYSLNQAKRSLYSSTAKPSECGIFVRAEALRDLELFAVRTNSRQRDWVDGDLKEQAEAAAARDKNLIDSVSCITKHYAEKPASAEQLMSLLFESRSPDAARRAICTQIHGQATVIDGDQPLSLPTTAVGNSVAFQSTQPYSVGLRISEVLDHGHKIVAVIEKTYEDCPIFSPNDLGNREVQLRVDSVRHARTLSSCMHLPAPIQVSVAFSVTASHRGLSYAGKLISFTQPEQLIQALTGR